MFTSRKKTIFFKTEFYGCTIDEQLYSRKNPVKYNHRINNL